MRLANLESDGTSKRSNYRKLGLKYPNDRRNKKINIAMYLSEVLDVS